MTPTKPDAPGEANNTLADELKKESTRLSCRMMDQAIRGKSFTMKEAAELHRKREEMLK